MCCVVFCSLDLDCPFIFNEADKKGRFVNEVHAGAHALAHTTHMQMF